jgi:hypothetical protein
MCSGPWVGGSGCGAPRGTEPDLLDEVAWWQTDDFWKYAPYAAVAYIRAAGRSADVTVRQAYQDLARARTTRHHNTIVAQPGKDRTHPFIAEHNGGDARPFAFPG